MSIEELKYKLKVMIIEECEKEEISADDISDDVEIFSHESGLDLDSVDALQISMALQHHYNIRIPDPKEFRRVVTTINNLANYISDKNG